MNIKVVCSIVLAFALMPAIDATYLFEQFKELKDAVPYVQLADLPTPVYKSSRLSNALNHAHIFIKRDDLTGADQLYGGNKVRKLEFLLGDAVQKGAKKIITFGCVGTNHGLATACYSKQLGLDCLLMLKNQPNSPVVKQNLLLDHYFGAQIAIFPNNQIRRAALDAIVGKENETYFIPTGGSVPLGALGYVNAAFELKDQIQKGMMPEPDFIYLPIGSCGTTAGLLLGFVLAKIKSKIIGVAVEPEEAVDEFEINTQKLFLATNELLHEQSTDIPLLEFPEAQLIINKDFCGEYYGQWLPAGDDAAQLMKSEENINLEGTYSAKAFAALIADVKNNSAMKNKIVLFWNTYCGLDFSQMINGIDYHQLNPEVHSYFE